MKYNENWIIMYAYFHGDLCRKTLTGSLHFYIVEAGFFQTAKEHVTMRPPISWWFTIVLEGM